MFDTPGCFPNGKEIGSTRKPEGLTYLATIKVDPRVSKVTKSRFAPSLDWDKRSNFMWKKERRLEDIRRYFRS